jgi:hypothetical protein
MGDRLRAEGLQLSARLDVSVLSPLVAEKRAEKEKPAEGTAKGGETAVTDTSSANPAICPYCHAALLTPLAVAPLHLVGDNSAATRRRRWLKKVRAQPCPTCQAPAGKPCRIGPIVGYNDGHTVPRTYHLRRADQARRPERTQPA